MMELADLATWMAGFFAVWQDCQLCIMGWPFIRILCGDFPSVIMKVTVTDNEMQTA
jgi:hypothetical protein